MRLSTAWLLEDAERVALPAVVRILAAIHFPPSHDALRVCTTVAGAGDFSDGHAPNVGVGPVTSQPPDMT